MNLKNQSLWGMKGVEATYSKPIHLCNQNTNSTNKNTSTSKKDVLNS